MKAGVDGIVFNCNIDVEKMCCITGRFKFPDKADVGRAKRIHGMLKPVEFNYVIISPYDDDVVNISFVVN